MATLEKAIPIEIQRYINTVLVPEIESLKAEIKALKAVKEPEEAEPEKKPFGRPKKVLE